MGKAIEVLIQRRVTVSLWVFLFILDSKPKFSSLKINRSLVKRGWREGKRKSCGASQRTTISRDQEDLLVAGGKRGERELALKKKANIRARDCEMKSGIKRATASKRSKMK